MTKDKMDRGLDLYREIKKLERYKYVRDPEEELSWWNTFPHIAWPEEMTERHTKEKKDFVDRLLKEKQAEFDAL